MKASKGKILLIGLLVICLAALFTGCKGSAGSAGPAGADGHDGIYGPQCVNCHHMSDQVLGISEPKLASLVTAATITPGVDVKLTAKSAFSAGTGTVNVLGYYWEIQGGLAATITGPVTGPTLTVRIDATQDYKAALVAAEQLPDRTMIVPVNGWSQSLAKMTKLKLWAWGDDGNIYYNVVNLTANDNDVNDYAPVLTNGLANVPIGVPILLNGRGTGYTWTLATPGSSGATLTGGANTKNPYFTPDVSGKYTLTLVTTPTGTTVQATDTLDIYAGTWQGAISGIDSNGKPLSSGCTSCHNDSTAPNKFATWRLTGHARILSRNIDDPTGHWSLSCASCHSVGYNVNATNGGFDEYVDTAFTDKNQVRDTTKWYPPYSIVDGKITAHGEVGAWAKMVSDYPSAAKLANIQCENCHGPNNDSTLHMNDTNSVRTSMSSDTCGVCHGSPTHHGRFQEWQESGHSNFDLAQGEGTSANCSGCHSAQGHLIWIKQLLAGNPLRGIPSAKITWNKQTVQPQTCQTCHDPHNEGTNPTTETDAQPRITGDTPKLPAGFAALGVGKGAQCIVCHNSRNGGVGSTNADGTTTGNSYLHEDNDPVFGMLTSYSTPHRPSQGDVLMGHNAYFMGSSGGNRSNYRSPHSIVTDSCVNCHMVKSPPPVEYSDYENTNHTFTASLEICASCHTTSSGLAGKLMSDTKAGLDDLLAGINQAIISCATGTYKGNIKTASYRSTSSIDLTFNNDTTATVSMATIVPLTSSKSNILAKTIWNYTLIKNDSSFGIHNPNFTRDVLAYTQAWVEELSK